MLYDHHKGTDFETTQVKSNFMVLSAQNLAEYSIFFDESRWAEADFRRLSRVENPALESYAFTPTAAFSPAP